MSASPQRLTANRENAKKSTGPKSDAGKERSRLNGLTHGLRSEAILLPGEDPDALDARREAWMIEWQPEGETELGHLEDALLASWRVDRCLRHETATLTKQILDAQDGLDETEQEEAEQLTFVLRGAPAETCRKLRRTVTGCRWLIGRWKQLQLILRTRKYWDFSERNHALNLLGRLPEEIWSEMVVNVVVSSCLTLTRGPKPPPESLIGHVPEPVWMGKSEFQRRLVAMAAALPSVEEATDALQEIVNDQIEELGERLERLQDRAARDRAATADRLCFDESKTGAARHRYELAHRRVMRQALDDLRKAQERRRSADAPSEPKPERVPLARPVSPDPALAKPVAPGEAPSEPKPKPADPAPSEPKPVLSEPNGPVATVREGLFSRVFTRSAATG